MYYRVGKRIRFFFFWPRYRLWRHIRWLCKLGILLFLSLLVLRGEATEAPTKTFTSDCSAFSRDAFLGPLHSRKSPAPPQLAAMMPRLSVRGTALATYASPNPLQPRGSIEAIFGVNMASKRDVIQATFEQEARAVILSSRVSATVAHALIPNSVTVQIPGQETMNTMPLVVTNTEVGMASYPGAESVAARIAHVNEQYDLALMQPLYGQFPGTMNYAAVLSYGQGDARNPTGGLEAGDCVATVIFTRDAQGTDTGVDQLVVGKVLAKSPVATNSLTQTKLNVNMFTTDLAVHPGDSGSPVLAIRNGQPVLIGLVSATMYPTALFTYVSRIDPLLALASALQDYHPDAQASPASARELVMQKRSSQ